MGSAEGEFGHVPECENNCVGAGGAVERWAMEFRAAKG